MSTAFEFPNTGKTIRLGRILRPRDRRAAVVAFDHGLHLGVIPGVDRPGDMLEQLAEAGADAFPVAPGTGRRFASGVSGRGAPGLILRVDWTNRWRSPEMLGSPEGRGRMIATVEGAAQLGADAVLTYLFLGYNDPDAEARQVEDPLREDLPVRDDDEEVGVDLREARDRGIVLQRRRLEDGEAELLRAPRDRRVEELGRAADRLRRLGDDEGDLVPRGEEPLERREGEVGRAEEDDAHRGPRPTVSAAGGRRRRSSRRGRGPRGSSRRPTAGRRSRRAASCR